MPFLSMPLLSGLFLSMPLLSVLFISKPFLSEPYLTVPLLSVPYLSCPCFPCPTVSVPNPISASPVRIWFVIFKIVFLRMTALSSIYLGIHQEISSITAKTKASATSSKTATSPGHLVEVYSRYHFYHSAHKNRTIFDQRLIWLRHIVEENLSTIWFQYINTL